MGSPEGTTKHPHNWRISQRQLSKLDTLLCTLGFTRKSGETHWPHLLPWEHRVAGSFITSLHVGDLLLPSRHLGDHPIPHHLVYCFFPILWILLHVSLWERSNFYIIVYQRQSLISMMPFIHKINAGRNSQNSAMQKHKANKWF